MSRYTNPYFGVCSKLSMCVASGIKRGTIARVSSQFAGMTG
jgi:hypothetical protein